MRTVNSAHSPKWSNYEQTQIDLMVDFDELDEVFVPFTASANDKEPHGPYLYERAVAGDFGEIEPFRKPDPFTGSDAQAILRRERTTLLEETDYIEMPTKWATLSESEQSAWAEYRNALRDMPANNPNAEMHWQDNGEETYWVNVTWPIKPE